MANFMANFVRKVEPVADKTAAPAQPEENPEDVARRKKLDEVLSSADVTDMDTLRRQLQQRWAAKRAELKPGRFRTVFDEQAKKLVIMKYLAVSCGCLAWKMKRMVHLTLGTFLVAMLLFLVLRRCAPAVPGLVAQEEHSNHRPSSAYVALQVLTIPIQSI